MGKLASKGRIGVAATAATVFGIALGLSLPSTAQDPGDAPAERTITVSGLGTVKTAPDEAIVSLGVQTQASTAQAAMNQNGERMSAVIRALLEAGVVREDIATSNVSLYPNYGSDGSNVTGFVASNTIDVTVKDLSKLGGLIDSAVEAGANLANGIMFRLSDENEGQEEALRGAVEDARGKAEILADAAGAGLGRVVTIMESSSGFPPPVYYEERAVAADGAGVPIIPPELETQVSVTVVWELV
jgi:uncharacterized protein YggE